IMCVLCLRKFIARLPDKGKKISDFAEKLKLAILQEEETERTAELLSAVRLNFQVKQEDINTSKQQVILNKDTLNHEGASVFNEKVNIQEVSEVSSQRHEADCTEQGATRTALKNERTQGGKEKVKSAVKDQSLVCEANSTSATSSRLENGQQVSQSNTEAATENAGDLGNRKDALVD
ncbi:GRL1A polymerase, partial [Alcedo cyanopectus]|nr:GRL1A polymerase [Ceyx cyanopectus]